MASRFRILGSLLLILMVACSPKLPDGRFACRSDSDCPARFRCFEQLCYRDPPTSDEPAVDEGDASGALNQPEQPLDAAAAEELPDREPSTTADADLPDAATMSRAPLRVLHASLRSAELTVELDGQRAPSLSYGQVSPARHGDPRTSQVRVRSADNTLLFELALTLREPTLLVLLDTGAGLSARVLELPALSGAMGVGASAFANATPVSVDFRGVDDDLQDAKGPTLGTGGVEANSPTVGAFHMMYVLRDQTQILVGFSDLPETARAAFVLMGDPGRALLDPRGLRLFVLDANAVRTIVPDPMVTFLHAATALGTVETYDGGGVYVPPLRGCFSNDLGLVEPLDIAYELDLPIPSQPLPVRENGRDFFHVIQPDDLQCDPQNHSVHFKELHLSKGRRYLIVIGDRPDSPTFTVLPEGQRETLTQNGGRMITLGNAGINVPDQAPILFDFGFWGSSNVEWQRASWAERARYATNQPLALSYRSCWPTLPCRPVTSNLLIAPIASISAFIVAIDPLAWGSPAMMRVITVLAHDGAPWTAVRTVN